MANTKIQSEQIEDDIALGGNPTTTTQSAGNNTTRVATTAFVTTAVAKVKNSFFILLSFLGQLLLQPSLLTHRIRASISIAAAVAASLPQTILAKSKGSAENTRL